jgi:hypothetical protein
MSDERQKLLREIQAFEATLNGRPERTAAKTGSSPKAELLGQIKQMEAKLACMCGDESEFEDEGPVAGPVEGDSFDAFDLKASEVDPSGVEESITQDGLSAVAELENKAGLATDGSMQEAAGGKVASAGYVARLRSASARLDRVATYLEQSGKKALALRVDKIADAIDARIKKEEGING